MKKDFALYSLVVGLTFLIPIAIFKFVFNYNIDAFWVFLGITFGGFFLIVINWSSKNDKK